MNPNDNLFDKFIAAIRGALRVIAIAVAVFGVLILIRSIVNALFLYNYGHGSYLTIAEHTVDNIMVGENYVIPYNLGNAEYQRQNYEKAIPYYWEALSKKMPETEEECKVRVNLALSMCHTIDFDSLDVTDPDAVMEAISVLLEARYVLTEKGCASEPVGSFDGHYANADKLRNDIDETALRQISGDLSVPYINETEDIGTNLAGRLRSVKLMSRQAAFSAGNREGYIETYHYFAMFVEALLLIWLYLTIFRGGVA